LHREVADLSDEVDGTRGDDNALRRGDDPSPGERRGEMRRGVCWDVERGRRSK
jgi:hypothetical protein